MSYTKEEIENLVRDFNNIADRTTTKNSKVSFNKILIITVIIVVIAAGIWYVMKNKKDKTKKLNENQKSKELN